MPPRRHTQVEAGPAKPGAGALAALAAALQSSHDVDPDELQPNTNTNAAALRARQQRPPEAKPRWGVVHAGGGSGSGGSSAAELSSELAAARDSGTAPNAAGSLPKPGSKRHGQAPGAGSVDDAEGWAILCLLCILAAVAGNSARPHSMPSISPPDCSHHSKTAQRRLSTYVFSSKERLLDAGRQRGSCSRCRLRGGRRRSAATCLPSASGWRLRRRPSTAPSPARWVIAFVYPYNLPD